MSLLTDDEFIALWVPHYSDPHANYKDFARAIESAVIAKHGAWSAAIAWVVRERNSASPMQSFENSLTDAQETKARWANDGYESDIVELCERVAL
jgi:hypothetical protein